MKRNCTYDLISWKNRPSRKPLLLEGARQVGKTHLLKEFGQSSYPGCHHFDFEAEPALVQLFEQNLDPERIRKTLSLLAGKNVNPAEELVIFDEIQNAPRALTALKYMAEEHPEWHVAATGSLLGIGLGQSSFPVGKVHWLQMYPMSFSEFLRAQGKDNLVEALENFNLREPEPEIMHQRAWDSLKEYFVTGGMPEVVSQYIDHHEDLPRAFREVRLTQKAIIRGYKNDIAKHAGKLKAVRIEAMLESVPLQLARENQSVKKFVFSNVLHRTSKYSELEGPLQWLMKAGLVYKVPICERAELPLAAHSRENRFVLYLFDVGLLGAMIDLAPESISAYNYGSYKGYFAENFVLQELINSGAPTLFNWQRGTAQIEFIFAHRDHVLPVEVKAGINTKAKSLTQFEVRVAPPASLLFCGKAYAPPMNKRHIFPLYMSGNLGNLLSQMLPD